MRSLGERYAIERELGRGGMAVVYLAFDHRHQRQVALKLLHPEPVAGPGAQRFLREIEIAARLNHPHILPVLDSGSVQVDDGSEVPFYVMPYVSGETLRERLRRERQLPVSEAVRLAREVADALHYAHAQGVVHRDIKPENILLSGGHAVVCDFGVARALTASAGASMTVAGVTIGTPQYMSPEQALGEPDIDARTDLYALGCVLYEMLAGEPPFTGAATNVVLARQLAGELPSLRTARPSVSAGLERVITRALAKTPADRFSSAEEFIAELESQEAPRGYWRKKRRAYLVAAGVVGTSAMAAILVLRGGDSPAFDTNLIAVAPFDVLGRSAELSLWREGMVDLLSRNLDGAGPLRTVSPTTVVRAWSGSAHAASAAELARRTGAGLIVFGQLRHSGGDSLRLVATLMDATTGASASDFEFRGVVERADLLADSLTLALLAELGRERVIQTLRLRGGSRAPLPALKSFLQGEQLFRRASWDSALTSYERAIALDSAFTFALYRAGLVLAWQRLDSDSLSSAYRYRAARSNHGLSPRDSLLVHADSVSSALYETPALAWGVRRQLIGGLQAAAERYPDDPDIWYTLGEEGFHHGMDAGMPREEVLAALERAIELDSSFAPAYVHAITLAFQLRTQNDGMRYARTFLQHAPVGFQSAGIGLALRLMESNGAITTEVQSELARVPPSGLFEGWAASLWSADTSDAAVVLARELVRRGRISAPLLADEAFRQDLLMAALMIRGRIREAAQMLELITPGAAAELAMVGALPRDWAERTFGGWLDRADGNAVYGLEWWGAEHDTVALRAFERLCAGPTKAEAPCFGDFGAQAARAYVALARRDSAGALERFLALPDTLCECVLQRFTTVRLLHHFGRDTEADARLRLPIAGLRRGVALAALLWKLERGRNAERMGDSATARREYSHVLELWRRADPELAQFRREAEDGLRRVQR